MKERLKQFLSTPKGKLTAALIFMVVSWTVILIRMSGDVSLWIPNEARRTALKRTGMKLREEERTLSGKLRKIEQSRKAYLKKKETAWNPEKDGAPEIILPQIVSEEAKKAGMALSNFGSVRTSRINHELYYAELDVSSTATYETVLKFVAGIAVRKPVLSWRRFNLNADLRRRNQNGKNSTATRSSSTLRKSAAETQNMMFSGTIRVIVSDEIKGNKGGPGK